MTTDPTMLLGTWSFARSIEDRGTGETTRVEGVASLALEDGRIRWREEGTWFRAATVVPVQRALWIEQREGGWFVTFEDGRDFHPWIIEAGLAHPCGRDTYTGLVTPGTDARQWSLEWEVSGPAKDYTMRTAYVRS